MLLLVAAGLSLIRSSRRVAAYIAVCSASGLIVSIIFSTLLLILVAKLPWPSGASTVGGVVMIGSYIGGLVLGGLFGVILGFLGLYRAFHKSKQHP